MVKLVHGLLISITIRELAIVSKIPLTLCFKSSYVVCFDIELKLFTISLALPMDKLFFYDRKIIIIMPLIYIFMRLNYKITAVLDDTCSVD